MKIWSHCIAVLFVLLIIRTSLAGQDRVQDFLDAALREYHAGNFSAAKTLYAEAMDAALVSRNEDLEAVISNGLGNAEISVDQPERASEAYKHALTIFRRKPEKYFELAATLRNLASAYSQQGKYDEALRLLKEAGKTLLSHPALADSQLLMAEILNSRGVVFVQQGKFAKAQSFFEQAIEKRTAAGVPDGLGDAQTLNNIGELSLIKHKYVDAESAFLKSLEITTLRLGSSHPDLTLTLISLGETYTAMGRYEEAERQFESSLTILRSVDTPLPGRVVRTLGLAGINYMKQGDERYAAQSFQEAIDLSRSKSVDESTLPGILDTYADLLQKQGKVDDAKDLRADAKQLRLKSALTVRVKTTETREP